MHFSQYNPRLKYGVKIPSVKAEDIHEREITDDHCLPCGSESSAVRIKIPQMQEMIDLVLEKKPNIVISFNITIFLLRVILDLAPYSSTHFATVVSPVGNPWNSLNAYCNMGKTIRSVISIKIARGLSSILRMIRSMLY